MFKRITTLFLIISFIFSYYQPVYAQPAPPQTGEFSINQLPQPGTMVSLSAAYEPVLIKGLKIDPTNPLALDFIVDTGNDTGAISDRPYLKKEAEKLIKYFFAALTLPEKDVWVNLSPYEKDRIIPQATGETEMGRDMLAQDYILKQITASLIYPEKRLGKDFWNRIYTQAYQRFGTTQIPVNTFNKVWIVADKASVYEAKDTVFVVDSHLKVMLEEDYLALSKHQTPTRGHVPEGYVSPSTLPTPQLLNVKAPQGNNPSTSAFGSQIVREIVLPALEKEVNEGKNFANLRQIFHSLILAKWYKETLKTALLNQVYSNKNKIAGVGYRNSVIASEAKQSFKDVNDVEVIYQQYLKAYKKGVFNYIKEDIDQTSKQPIPRKYFSGGVTAAMTVKDLTRPEFLSRALKSLFSGPGMLLSIAVKVKAELERRLIMDVPSDYSEEPTIATIDPEEVISKIQNALANGIKFTDDEIDVLHHDGIWDRIGFRKVSENFLKDPINEEATLITAENPEEMMSVRTFLDNRKLNNSYRVVRAIFHDPIERINSVFIVFPIKDLARPITSKGNAAMGTVDINPATPVDLTNLRVVEDKKAMAKEAVRGFIEAIYQAREKKRGTGIPPVMGLGTGSTIGLFDDELIDEFKRDRSLNLSDIILLAQDEYVGLDANNLQSYHYFVTENLIKKLMAIDPSRAINPDHFIFFRGDAASPEEEIKKVVQRITGLGGIDWQLLAGGKDGHFAFVCPAVKINSLGSLQTSEMIKNIRDRNEIEIDKENITVTELVELIKAVIKIRREQRETLGQEDKQRDVIEEAVKRRMEFLGLAQEPAGLRETIKGELVILGRRMLDEQSLTVYISPSDSINIEALSRDLPPDLQGKVLFKDKNSFWTEPAKIVDLTLSTMLANSRFFPSLAEVPLKALTLAGLLLEAKKIVHISFKPEMALALNQMILGPLTSENPFSILPRQHRRYDAIFTKDVVAEIKKLSPENVLEIFAVKQHFPKKDEKPPLIRMKINPIISSNRRWVDKKWQMSAEQKAVIKLAIQGETLGLHTLYQGPFYMDGSDQPKSATNPEVLSMRGRRILIAEDDVTRLETLANKFREEGAIVETFEKGDLAYSRLIHGDFDLAVADKNMPGMNGDELVRKVRKIKPHQRFIMWTAGKEDSGLGIPIVGKDENAVVKAAAVLMNNLPNETSAAMITLHEMTEAISNAVRGAVNNMVYEARWRINFLRVFSTKYPRKRGISQKDVVIAIRDTLVNGPNFTDKENDMRIYRTLREMRIAFANKWNVLKNTLEFPNNIGQPLILARDPHQKITVWMFLKEWERQNNYRVEEVEFNDPEGNISSVFIAFPNNNAAMNGGIDLNASKIKMKRTGSGIQIKFDPAMIERFKMGNFDGIVPVITGITPITNIYPLLGLTKT